MSAFLLGARNRDGLRAPLCGEGLVPLEVVAKLSFPVAVWMAARASAPELNWVANS